jgi:Ca2+-dependent lipid-binding protein
MIFLVISFLFFDLDPYFKIYMFYKQQRIMKKRSTIKRTTQSPVYNECFTFHIPDNDIENIYFDLILFDYDRHMKHEAIGMYSIGKELNQHWDDVCHRQKTKQIAHWYQFKPFNGTI